MNQGARKPTKRRIKRDPVPQTPKERLIPNNKRVVSPSGKTTWEIKAPK